MVFHFIRNPVLSAPAELLEQGTLHLFRSTQFLMVKKKLSFHISKCLLMWFIWLTMTTLTTKPYSQVNWGRLNVPNNGIYVVNNMNTCSLFLSIQGHSLINSCMLYLLYPYCLENLQSNPRNHHCRPWIPSILPWFLLYTMLCLLHWPLLLAS